MSRAGRTREQERLDALRLRTQQAAAGGVLPRCCAWPGCDATGEYRAPAGRERLREFQFLCLDHVREFNRKWDYFSGMSMQEIEAHQRADSTWHRPSWRFGTAAALGPDWNDVYGLFGDGERARPRPPPQRPPTKAERMMTVLGLEEGFTLDELKARYKLLAKRNHPDLNGGDKEAGERLRLIIEAYTFLRSERLYA